MTHVGPVLIAEDILPDRLQARHGDQHLLTLRGGVIVVTRYNVPCYSYSYHYIVIKIIDKFELFCFLFMFMKSSLVLVFALTPTQPPNNSGEVW